MPVNRLSDKANAYRGENVPRVFKRRLKVLSFAVFQGITNIQTLFILRVCAFGQTKKLLAVIFLLFILKLCRFLKLAQYFLVLKEVWIPERDIILHW